VTAADLNAVPPAAEAEAPAVALQWDIHVDDRDYPQERTITEYVRYKIFDPEKSVPLTRLSEFVASVGGESLEQADIQARVTLASGAVREFGRQDIQERTLNQTGENGVLRFFSGNSAEIQERYLAVGGLEAGAILEIRITRHTRSGGDYACLLQKSVPAQHLHFVHDLPGGFNWSTSGFLSQPLGITARFDVDHDHNREVVTADNLPSLVPEPLSLPAFSRSLAYFLSARPAHEVRISRNINRSIEIRSSDGLWARIAALEYLRVEDAVYGDYAVGKQASILTSGAGSGREKALRIHEYVQRLFRDFSRGNRGLRISRAELPPLGHVMHFDQYPNEPIVPNSFVLLEIGLDRAAGLKAQEVMMADRSQMEFDSQLASDMFLRRRAVWVNCDGEPVISFSATTMPLAFGELPWYLRGEPALIAKSGPQQFVGSPGLAPTESSVTNIVDVTLDPDGTLHGTGKQTIVGPRAQEIRAALIGRTNERRRQLQSRRMASAFGADARTMVTGMEGIDEPGAPVTLEFNFTVPNYALITAHRIIFRPDVMRLQASSQFAAAERHNAVFFHFPTDDSDEITFHYPDGYSLESPSIPPGFPGRQLRYEVGASYSARQHLLTYHRKFWADVGYVPLEFYSNLKAHFDAVAREDQQQFVLRKS
jgi:hypothetical protein